MPRPSRFKEGATYNRLTAGTKDGLYATYQCSCGTRKRILIQHVLRGRVQSCGCLHKEIISALMTKRSTKHGMYGTRCYAVWNSMRDRCTNPNSQAWSRYGGRGITLCARWRKFENFHADMGDPPKGLTLERVNNNKGYSKANCRWATRKEQQNNRHNTKYLAHKGKKLSVSQWAEYLGIDRQLIYSRLRRGWSAKQALTGVR